MIEVDWFAKTDTLAIADVIYVKGIGLCSHQPDFDNRTPGKHRMMNIKGKVHYVTTDMLFDTEPEERHIYWQYVHKGSWGDV